MKSVFVMLTDKDNVAIEDMDSEGAWIDSYLSDQKRLLPDWCAKSQFHCPDCTEPGDFCRVAAALSKITEYAKNVSSIEHINLSVITSKGHIINRDFTAQEGFSVVFLSAITLSGCHVFKKYAWAFDHYRISTDIKGLFYIFLSSLLTYKYLTHGDTGHKTVEEEFIAGFNAIKDIIRGVIKVLLKESKKDANVNALVRIDSIAYLLKESYKDHIELLRNSFKV